MEGDTIILSNVQLVPDLNRNLLSVNEVIHRFGTVVFDNNCVKFVHGKISYNKENVVLEGSKQKNGLYTVDLNIKEEAMLFQSFRVAQQNGSFGL